MSALPYPAVAAAAGLRAGLDDIAGVLRASHLGQRPAPAPVSTGIASLEALIGGLPRGALTEICGPASSGRTSVLLSVMAQMTRGGEVCALVDASDSFDPASAQAAGVELSRMLWVRCSHERTQRRRGAENKIADYRLPMVDCVERRGGSRKSAIDHQPSALSHQPSAFGRKSAIGNRQSAMPLLEQTLKATDLLLQGGGFGLVVVDLADIPPAAARRVPLTSWFRFRRAVENTATVLLVLEQEPYAKTCASVVVRLGRQSSVVSRQPETPAVSNQHSVISIPAHAQVLRGLEIHAELVRDRNQQKKPVRSAGAQFLSRTEWAVNL